MKVFFLFFVLMACIGVVYSSEPRKVCLNMIVKNESAVITRCLNSVKPLIDYWVIVDTGSTDNTKELIHECLKDISGELYEKPWINFEENRNQALELARDKADYILFIDADEVFQFSPEYKFPELNKDIYFIMSDFDGIQYARTSLINSRLNTRWVGVLHEVIDSTNAKTSEVLTGIKNIVYTDGARSKDPEKYLKDVQILEAALEKDPFNLRYIFYLAQSYKDAGKYEEALGYYHRRIAMGKGVDEEVFWCFMQIGIIQEILQKPSEVVIDSYLKAYLLRPTRAEPLFHLAHYYRKKGDYFLGYLAAKQGLTLSPPHDLLFVESWVYDYGLLLEYSICSSCLEKYQDALLSLYLMLGKNLPSDIRASALKNVAIIEANLRKNAMEFVK